MACGSSVPSRKQLPRAAADLTAPWLNETLGLSGTCSVKISAVAKPGVNADVVRLAVRGHGGRRDIHHLVAKFPPGDPERRRVLRAMGWDRREVEFYRLQHPRLVRYLVNL